MFKMSAGCNADCQSLVPFTGRIINHFLVQTVPFLLDTLVQLFHVRDLVAATEGGMKKIMRRGRDCF